MLSRQYLVFVVSLLGACASGTSSTSDDDGPDACVPRSVFADADGDGFGDRNSPVTTCNPDRTSTSIDSSDCDDTNPNIHPDASEACDGADTDCNGTIDDGVCAVGCSDGEREGYLDSAAFPDVAACSGGWEAPGVLPEPARVCLEPIGDDSVLPIARCSALDLCAVGWSLCATGSELLAATADAGCASATSPGDPPLFFAASISGPGNLVCGAGANDLFGCGNIGAVTGSCGPFNRSSQDLCSSLPVPWSCGVNGTLEAQMVTKQDATSGGVLCCRNATVAP